MSFGECKKLGYGQSLGVDREVHRFRELGLERRR